MEKVVPQKVRFEQAEKYDVLKTRVTVVIIFVSIISAVWTKVPLSAGAVDSAFAVIIFIATAVKEFYDYRFNYTYREAELMRRDSFLDDAFGSKIAPVAAEGYYDTEDVKLGLGKVLANIHDNSYISSKVLSGMLKKKEVKLLITGIIIATVTLFNLAGTQFVVSVLDLFLSISIFRDYLEMKNLKSEIDRIEIECRNLWTVLESEKKSYCNQEIAKIMQLYVRYETALAYASMLFDEDEFDNINEPSTEEWKEIKMRYNISQKTTE